MRATSLILAGLLGGLGCSSKAGDVTYRTLETEEFSVNIPTGWKELSNLDSKFGGEIRMAHRSKLMFDITWGGGIPFPSFTYQRDLADRKAEESKANPPELRDGAGYQAILETSKKETLVMVSARVYCSGATTMTVYLRAGAQSEAAAQALIKSSLDGFRCAATVGSPSSP